ncbi:hypothetical protein CO165_02855 [Candidatus Roizmanbacteria bacterium CG_4_9_14_3_um_filter_33_18]|uniref:Uncharacterized protein n=1 Tax=Candidatus Roizmanbacteria bacterium CG_4_9_14_3_um_filter_33_18 TaxID=1974841 RepID=A0A2M7XXV6_9BACT|nr:MAG: hypothetical protein CO165_02855 [Candidatus Roizmanbacteria bacterium CG_4_9_14_3_um_filter_33_18]
MLKTNIKKIFPAIGYVFAIFYLLSQVIPLIMFSLTTNLYQVKNVQLTISLLLILLMLILIILVIAIVKRKKWVYKVGLFIGVLSLVTFIISPEITDFLILLTGILILIYKKEFNY